MKHCQVVVHLLTDWYDIQCYDAGYCRCINSELHNSQANDAADTNQAEELPRPNKVLKLALCSC